VGAVLNKADETFMRPKKNPFMVCIVYLQLPKSTMRNFSQTEPYS